MLKSRLEEYLASTFPLSVRCPLLVPLQEQSNLSKGHQMICENALAAWEEMSITFTISGEESTNELNTLTRRERLGIRNLGRCTF
jgi:hypothetical protein